MTARQTCRLPLSPGIIAALRAADPEYARAQADPYRRRYTRADGPERGVCTDCDRPMVTSAAFRDDPTWAQRGYARHAARYLCNSCYTLRRRKDGRTGSPAQ